MDIWDELARERAVERQRRQSEEEEPEDGEETMSYKPVEKRPFLNQDKGAFAERKFEGINSRRSVFDETAVFTTGAE